MTSMILSDAGALIVQGKVSVQVPAAQAILVIKEGPSQECRMDVPPDVEIRPATLFPE